MPRESRIKFKHARFSTRLPADYLYSPSHYWMTRDEECGEPGVWRVGFTKFATRILGELVECEFDVKENDPVTSGGVIGYVEGFKAMSDLYCVVDGEFRGGNPALQADACIIRNDPYTVGWLYRIKGTPEPAAVDVHGYVDILDATIGKMMAQEEGK
jgi:glycine cleavage system H protein